MINTRQKNIYEEAEAETNSEQLLSFSTIGLPTLTHKPDTILAPLKICSSRDPTPLCKRKQNGSLPPMQVPYHSSLQADTQSQQQQLGVSPSSSRLTLPLDQIGTTQNGLEDQTPQGITPNVYDILDKPYNPSPSYFPRSGYTSKNNTTTHGNNNYPSFKSFLGPSPLGYSSPLSYLPQSGLRTPTTNGNGRYYTRQTRANEIAYGCGFPLFSDNLPLSAQTHGGRISATATRKSQFVPGDFGAAVQTYQYQETTPVLNMLKEEGAQSPFAPIFASEPNFNTHIQNGYSFNRVTSAFKNINNNNPNTPR